ncbi:MAG: cytochrome biogenesis protein ResB [Oceanospirillaceae bacterium]|uniref:c-type cytochrome n=1 Tax=unclassified Thalassolituus TaxID=2624967 RepID=UPI000C615734|nr:MULTISPECIES: c-type cytochrome [unclassified Thalassolituus]MAS24268.1 cytochrome biogenesis protein ResB [Oceanospirillaceae bacterium]MBL33448.1 cytochrome biogenesis protein ResB [Oceanospirillaceae bacterium]MBS54292.1 cytochrome biogenesis protein ResB [Oceanospirillaceae bacterium]|tara:strand:- start:5087 stop:5716 length:630 start_codon:yes stop_codon:yes gene_type:complete
MIRILMAVVVSLASFSAAADSVESMLQELAIIENNPALHQAALEDGKERATLCVRCHGDDGNSKRDYIPNLASQNASYLFTQFEHFANGVRKDYVMSKLAVGLSKDDRIAVALYFAQMDVKPREQPVPSNARGAAVYNSVCFVCHGKEGHGSQQYPRIAGQPYAYLEATLMKFLNNDPERQNSPMMGVIKNMNEQQLKDVAAFVANMPQ